MSESRPVTPRPSSRSPFQNPTPKTPERQERTPDAPMQGKSSSANINWLDHTPASIKDLSEDDAKETLNLAIHKVRSLENDIRTSKLQAAHFRFNYQMLLSDQEERSKRSQVEFELLNSSQDLLYNKLNRAEDEERTFRNRHLKAKRKVAELMEENKRQQLSIDHLKQAMSTGSNFGLGSQSSSSQPQMDGGLEVLSDAAGMAQKRDLDQSKDGSTARLQAGQLLSPVAFEQVPLPHLPTRAAKRRRESEDSAASETDLPNDVVSGKRSTFNSGGSVVHLPSRAAPITPKSPRRAKLAPSAMT